MHQKSEGSDRNNVIVEGAYVTARLHRPHFSIFGRIFIRSGNFWPSLGFLTSNLPEPKGAIAKTVKTLFSRQNPGQPVKSFGFRPRAKKPPKTRFSGLKRAFRRAFRYEVSKCT